MLFSREQAAGCCVEFAEHRKRRYQPVDEGKWGSRTGYAAGRPMLR
jgi:hypothetical protein